MQDSCQTQAELQETMAWSASNLQYIRLEWFRQYWGVEVSWLVHECWSYTSIIPDGGKPAFPLISAKQMNQGFPG